MDKTRQRLGTDYPRQERSNNAGSRIGWNLAQVRCWVERKYWKNYFLVKCFCLNEATWRVINFRTVIIVNSFGIQESCHKLSYPTSLSPNPINILFVLFSRLFTRWVQFPGIYSPTRGMTKDPVSITREYRAVRLPLLSAQSIMV